MSLGVVPGASDLFVSVSIVRNEGTVPPPGVYPAPWFGKGAWLDIDEVVTKDGDGEFSLHTPTGTILYDFPIRVPWHAQLDPDDDSKSPLFRAYRTRPFDGA